MDNDVCALKEIADLPTKITGGLKSTVISGSYCYISGGEGRTIDTLNSIAKWFG